LKAIWIYAIFLSKVEIIRLKEKDMHIDESKKFDKRNIERNIKDGIITLKDYETYLSKLPDISDKIYDPDKDMDESEEVELSEENENTSSGKGLRKKVG